MRLMKRNLRKIWYCLYNDNIPVLDEDGYETGETTSGYGEPIAIDVNVSPASGYAQTEMFGNLDNYDKVVLTDDMSCPIDENTVLFVDHEPEFDEEDKLINKHDYTVKRVAKSLNHISYAVSGVNIK